MGNTRASRSLLRSCVCLSLSLPLLPRPLIHPVSPTLLRSTTIPPVCSRILPSSLLSCAPPALPSCPKRPPQPDPSTRPLKFHHTLDRPCHRPQYPQKRRDTLKNHQIRLLAPACVSLADFTPLRPPRPPAILVGPSRTLVRPSPSARNGGQYVSGSRAHNYKISAGQACMTLPSQRRAVDPFSRRWTLSTLALRSPVMRHTTPSLAS